MRRAIAFYMCMSFVGLVITTPAGAQTPSIVLKGQPSAVFSLAFSRDGRVLLSGSRDGSVIAWNVPDGTQRASYPVLKMDVNTIAISGDGKWVAAGGGEKVNTIQLYDVEKRQLERPLDGHEKGVTSLAFSPDGTHLASASFDHTVKIWDLKTRTAVRTIKGHLVKGESRPVNAVAYSPDGKWLASGGNDGFLRFWDPKTGEQKGAFETVVAVDSIAFNPDGTRVAAAGGPGRKVHVWNMESGQEVLTLTGHTAGVTCVRFSPDGSQIASGSQDKTIRLWNAKTGQDAGVLSSHDQNVYCLAYSPDGKILASGSGDRTVRLWKMMPAQ